jgi:hypothetical protein
MTRIKAESPVTRETSFIDRGRALIVTLHPRHFDMRFRGTRTRWTVSYDACLWLAVKRVAAARKQEKIDERKARSGK